MNKLRRTCAVAIVTAVLAVPVFAGIMDSPGVVSPPAPEPTPTPTTSTSTSSTITMILTILDLIRG